MGKLTTEQREQRALARARRAAVAAEEEDRRTAQRQAQWRRDGSYMSHAELVAGEHCRGCGLPILDGQGNWPPLNQLTPEQQAEYEQANADFRERHRDCRAGRWNMSGHRTAHCCYCCPPPPLSAQQIEQISQILSSPRVRKKDLDDWDLTLTCEHVVRLTQHRDHDRYSARVADCPECGQRQGVITTKRIGPAGDTTGRIRRERLAAELATAQAKLERQRRAIAKTERSVAEFAQSLSDLGD